MIKKIVSFALALALVAALAISASANSNTTTKYVDTSGGRVTCRFDTSLYIPPSTYTTVYNSSMTVTPATVTVDLWMHNGTIRFTNGSTQGFLGGNRTYATTRANMDRVDNTMTVAQNWQFEMKATLVVFYP